MFERSRFLLTMPAPAPPAESRNLLVSVDGRSANFNLPLDQEHCEFNACMGSFVFIRVWDKGRDNSLWVYETDFLLVPGEEIPEENGLIVRRVD
jgi:hypothetical protein